MNCHQDVADRTATIVVTVCLALSLTLSGCMCRFYSYDVDAEVKKNGVETYNVVDSLTMEEYPQSLPVTVSTTETTAKSDSGVGPILWFFTLGIISGWECHTTTYTTTVSSPIGTRSGTCSVTQTKMMGWIPLFLPISHEESNKTRLAKDTLQRNLVSQFSKDEYATFAKAENEARQAEVARIESIQKQVHELIAKNLYSEATSLIATASTPRTGTKDGDAEKWNALRHLTQEKAEDYRIANKKADLLKKFVEQKFEDVVLECEKEHGGEKRHAAIWTDLRDKAARAISERDRKIELARIEKHKAEVESLLGKKEYKAVLAECEKETGCNAGSRPEDAEIWTRFRQQAKQAQDKIDRDQELARIEGKVAQIEKWLKEEKYDLVVAACNEEQGINPGSQAEDMMRFRSYRSKALGLRLLQKATTADKSMLNIKGFSLGMSMEEVEILLDYHFASVPHTREGNLIKVAGHSMAFCQAENDRIIKFSFNRDMLDKLFDYDSQDPRGWATAFAREYGMNFRGTSVRDRASRGDASISVSQDCYVNRDKRKGMTVSIFGEQDVSDYNKDPDEIEREANAAALQMTFSGNGNNSSAYNLGMRYGQMAGNVKNVRKWLKEEYVNGKGAEDWTLRIEVLK